MKNRPQAKPLACLQRRDPIEARWIRHWVLSLLIGCGFERRLAESPEDLAPVAQVLKLGPAINPCWDDAVVLSQPAEKTLRQRLVSLRRLASESRAPKPGVLSHRQRNLRALATYLGLSDGECRVFELCVFLISDPALQCIQSELGTLTVNDSHRILAYLLALPIRDVEQALRPAGLLRTTGLIKLDDGFSLMPSSGIEVLPRIGALLNADGFEADRFLDEYAAPAPAAVLSTASDYPHIHASTHLIKRLLASSVERRVPGINILIHGEPGTGKSEYARALAAELDLKAREVRTSDNDGDPIEGYQRASAYQITQQLFQRTPRSVLVFEEMEDLLIDGGGDRAPFSVPMRRGIGKGWFNRMLEQNPVPTLWLTNAINGVDPAYLRRFSYVMEMPQPPRTVRRQILKRYFDATPARADWIEQLAEHRELAPSLIEQSARVAGTLETTSAADFESEVERILTGTLRAMGHRRPLSSRHNDVAGYDVAYINTDIAPGSILAALSHGRGGRVCLFGPPGTGKTEFAKHLARALDRPLLIRRASDVLSMWWGGTEANIARMFGDAETEQAVLLMDEVDSLLKDRGAVQHSWEASQVNELLTQMEDFQGIFIASTNLVDHLDPAALRRFDFKVKFDFMTLDQHLAMFKSIVHNTGDGQMAHAVLRERLQRLECLTPGDFAVALRQARMAGQPLDATHLLRVLETECAHKTHGQPRSIGFTGTL